MQTVALINYGSGNLRSAEKALVKAAVVKPEKTRLTSYGFTTFGAFLSGDDTRVFGLDGTNILERKVCP